jgi:2-polyprenyl-3-methyl-5-hydroxy-6-metoxy-1,4-benzoquinol methylase
MPVTLAQAFEELPGLENFCSELWGNFVPLFAMKKLHSRATVLLEALPEEVVRQELKEWSRLKLVPSPDPKNQDLVGVLWQSPLFICFMDAVGFFPPPEVDLRPHMAPLYASLEEIAEVRTALMRRCERGQMARGDLPYWQMVLKLQAPHLYLEPYLPQSGELQGCDLACGWGRICLTLSEYKNRRIHACDLAESSLLTLRKLAEQRELPGTIETHRVDILNLPYSDNFFDFYLAFDIFEHLVDDVLSSCLKEMLRCGKPGAPLYTETPLMCFCPALTHLQNWSEAELTAAFEKERVDGKSWRRRLWDPRFPDHFTFVIEQVD